MIQKKQTSTTVAWDCFQKNSNYFQGSFNVVTANPNASIKLSHKPIQLAADNGNGGAKIIKILAPLADNPNEPDTEQMGITPIHTAVDMGALEVIKILAPLTNNPNAPDKSGWTPMHKAAFRGEIEMIKYLAPMTNELNSRDQNVIPPIDAARSNGHMKL